PTEGGQALAKRMGGFACVLRSGHERYAESSTRGDGSSANWLPPRSRPAVSSRPVEGGEAESSGNGFEARGLNSGPANSRSSGRRDRYRHHERERQVASRRILHAKAGRGG